MQIYARLLDASGNLISDEAVNNNEKYGNINLWKNYNLSDVFSSTEFANEIVHYYYLPKLFNFETYLKINQPTLVIFEGNHPDFDFLRGYFRKKGVLKDNKSTVFHRRLKYSFKLIGSILAILFFSHLIWMYGFSKSLTFRRRKQRVRNHIDVFALIHSKASYNKIKALKENTTYFIDSKNFSQYNQDATNYSFYEILSIPEYLVLIFTIIPKSLASPYRLVKDVSPIFGVEGAAILVSFFVKRFGHYQLIKRSYQKIFAENKGKVFYSGERESRYAPLAMNLANASGCFGKGVPHGIAYSYNFPLGIFGHEYYCCNEFEATYLNEIYQETKFVFDKSIMAKIYPPKENKAEEIKKVVFFTEPRRYHVNLEILDFLCSEVDVVYIKLHPLDEQKRYQHYGNVKFIDDFNEAIHANICLARKSSILIEALYYDSKSIAVLVDKQDGFDYKNTFPALSDKEIFKCFSFTDLIERINMLKDEK